MASSRCDNCLCLFKSFWLYGGVEPPTLESLFPQLSQVAPQCYQRFLAQFSQAYPHSLNLQQVANGRFHPGTDLMLPQVILLFHPPSCPELNPIERLWKHLNPELKSASFPTLAQLQTKVEQLLAELTPEVIACFTAYSFILEPLLPCILFKCGIRKRGKALLPSLLACLLR